MRISPTKNTLTPHFSFQFWSIVVQWVQWASRAGFMLKCGNGQIKILWHITSANLALGC